MQIGEVSRRSGVSVRMLRHYDRIGLVRPSARTGAGYREYAQADLRRLFQVEALRTLSLPLAQVAAALDDPEFDAAAALSRLIGETEARISAERQLLGRLREIEATAPQGWDEALDVVELLTGLRSGAASDRQSAALRSGAAPQPVLGQLVDAYLAETEPSVAGALRWAIVQAGQPAVALLAARATDADPDVRSRIVWALTAIDSATASAALAGFVDDPVPRIAGRAVLALASRQPPQPGPGLEQMCSRLVDMIAAGIDDVDAAEKLGALAARSPDTAATVIALVESRMAALEQTGPAGTDASGRGRLVQALGEIPGESAGNLLRSLLDDPDAAVARTARYLLDGRR